MRNDVGIPAPRAPLGVEQRPWPANPVPGGVPGPSRQVGRSSRTPWIVLGIATLLVAVLAVLLTVVVRPGSSGSADATTVATPPSGPSSPVAPSTGDPERDLQAFRRADAAVAERTLGSWLPQVSAKKVGMVVDGRTYDAAAVLADHQRLRAQYPGALLVWSGDWSSFRGDDFWITLVESPSAAAASANAWCDRAGLGADDCYAKRLSRTGGYAGNTAMRSAAGPAPSSPAAVVPGGTPPTLGGAGASGTRGFGDVRPGEINANGDGTSYVDGVTWSSWGGPTARGTGTASWVPPTGFVSDGVQTPAIVVATDLGTCHGVPAYRRVGWYFPSKGETGVAPGDGYSDICDGP